MVNLSECHPFWKNPHNKVHINVVNFENQSTMKTINYTYFITGISLLTMTATFLWSWKGPKVVQCIWKNKLGSYIGFIIALKPFLLHFLPEITDTFTDVYYFSTLNEMKTLVHPWNGVVILMAVILGMTIVKDILCTRWFVDLFYWHTTNNEIIIDEANAALSKVKKLAISAVLEDLGQVILQFYFFERYTMKGNAFLYINTSLMVLSAVFYFVAILKPIED